MKAELLLGNLKREFNAWSTKYDKLSASLEREWDDDYQKNLVIQECNALSMLLFILQERIDYIESFIAEKKQSQEDTPQEENAPQESDGIKILNGKPWFSSSLTNEQLYDLIKKHDNKKELTKEETDKHIMQQLEEISSSLADIFKSVSPYLA